MRLAKRFFAFLEMGATKAMVMMMNLDDGESSSCHNLVENEMCHL